MNDQTSSYLGRAPDSDVLSDVVAALGVNGSVNCRCDLTAPWGMRFEPDEPAVFHLVSRGNAWLTLDSGESLPLASGDLVVCRRGLAHTISDDPATPPTHVIRPGPEPDEYATALTFGGPGHGTRLVCGGFRFHAASTHPLLDLLPPVIHLRTEDGPAAEWHAATMATIASEAASGRPGSRTIVRRLSDVLFIQVLRSWLERQPLGSGGWLEALRDPHVGVALAAIHATPEKPWTVTSLASEASASRSAFAAQFTRLVGEPPMRYLTRWRVQSAANLLRTTQLSTDRVAARVGYGSSAALSRTFKRELGLGPGAYRLRARTPSGQR